ncbi:MAG: hypothetical protein ABJD07_00325 [Gemmatimonadaceae bacterium]
MRSGRLAVAGAAALMSVAGCASIHGRSDPIDTPGAREVSCDVLDCASAGTAWELLRRTANNFTLSQERISGGPTTIMGRRGRSSLYLADADVPILILDGARLIDARVLQQTSASDISRIKFINGIEGTVYQGTNAGGGVIIITTRGLEP